MLNRFWTRPKPRTVVGLWLRAMLMNEVEVRRELARNLNNGQRGWNDDEAGLAEAACELAVRRYYGKDHDGRQISDDVSFMREADLTRGKTPPGSQAEMEAVIRSALGEPDIDISGIIPPALLTMRLAAVGWVVLKRQLPESEVIKLIIRAEEVTIGRGWRPPLAS